MSETAASAMALITDAERQDLCLRLRRMQREQLRLAELPGNVYDLAWRAARRLDADTLGVALAVLDPVARQPMGLLDGRDPGTL